MLALVMK